MPPPMTAAAAPATGSTIRTSRASITESQPDWLQRGSRENPARPFRSFCRSFSAVERVEFSRGVAIERGLVRGARAFGDALERVPQRLVAAGRAVDREV